MINSDDKDTKLQESEKKKVLEISDNITVKDFAEKMGIKATDLIAVLIKNKIYASINEVLDFETAVIIADDFNFELVKKKSEMEKRRQRLRTDISPGARKRPPVVVVMGHVDHGKTTLLDKILETNVVSREFGGITQHFSAYQVKKKGESITFLDTPGHEAFHAMRQRGAYITDIAVIVVAADDGVKPQTIEAVDFAKSAGVPIIVALNKVDKADANVERVKKQLSEIDLAPEEWGGKTTCVSISAKTGEGIDELLDMILLTADMEELKANPNSPAEGFVFESNLDPKIGPVAKVLIQNGTLKEGDYMMAGATWGKIKRICNFAGKKISKATPSMPVTIIGLSEVPKAGSLLSYEVSRFAAEKKSKEFAFDNKDYSEARPATSAKIKEMVKSDLVKKLNLVIKADTKGSLEAIIQILETMGNENAIIQILKAGAGNITETDIKLARSSKAKVVGFNIDISSDIKKFADKEKVNIKIYNIIYDLVDEVKEELSSLLEPEIIRTDLGTLKVIAIFKSGKKAAKVVNMIFGAKVEDGKIEKASFVEVLRNGEVIGKGVIKELQYNKKAVEEVKVGNNAGITFEGNVIVALGDVIKGYKEEKRRVII
ncbi:MAG: translation initiation factor IF-2 [Minisyncoccia bacterium]